MRKLLLSAIFATVISGCSSSGGAVSQIEYVKVKPLPELPADRMSKPNFGSRVRAELLQPEMKPTQL